MAAAGADGEISFATATERATWSWTILRDLELSGPMTLRLRLALDGAAEANLFAGVEKWRDGHFVPFEGSYGFGYDRVTTGWRKVSQAETDGEIEVELGPSATFFRAGEELRLVLGGRWLHPTNLVTGQYPARYEPSPDCTVRVLCGGTPAARLLVPLVD
jgi:predicted acyl esterase